MAKLSITDPKEILSFVFSHFGAILLIVAAFLVGSLWTEVRYLKSGGPSTTTTTPTAQQPAAGQPQQPTVSLDKIKELFTKGNNIKFGDANRKVLFVEFSDPSCPYCHIAAGKNPELNKQAGAQFTLVSDGGTYVAPVEEMRKLVNEKKASYVLLYSPGHGNGELGAKALYCAFEKGKFWEVHDILMTNKGYDLLNNTIKNDKAKSGELAEFTKSAMNANDMKSCLESGKYDARIAEDTALAAAYGAQGTPGFYVNTQNYAGAYSWNDMKSVVEAALK